MAKWHGEIIYVRRRRWLKAVTSHVERSRRDTLMADSPKPACHQLLLISTNGIRQYRMYCANKLHVVAGCSPDPLLSLHSLYMISPPSCAPRRFTITTFLPLGIIRYGILLRDAARGFHPAPICCEQNVTHPRRTELSRGMWAHLRRISSWSAPCNISATFRPQPADTIQGLPFASAFIQAATTCNREPCQCPLFLFVYLWSTNH